MMHAGSNWTIVHHCMGHNYGTTYLEWCFIVCVWRGNHVALVHDISEITANQRTWGQQQYVTIRRQVGKKIWRITQELCEVICTWELHTKNLSPLIQCCWFASIYYILHCEGNKTYSRKLLAQRVGTSEKETPPGHWKCLLFRDVHYTLMY